MKIAVDAMGGDYAPGEIVRGVLQALADREVTAELVLVGRTEEIEPVIAKYRKPFDRSRLSIVHAPEVIGMAEAPVPAVRSKKHASLSVALNLHKEGGVDAVISAGNTGAVLVASTLKLRTIPEIERPAIALVFPSLTGQFLLLDGGANSECRPRHLQQFGIMGSVYSKYFYGIENPRVGLLNIGHEEGKGNELVKEAYGMLKDAPVNFAGNVEGKDAFFGNVDVVLADGFVGNVLLKFSESLAAAMIQFIKQAIRRHPVSMLGALLMRPAFEELRRKTHYAQYGAAPLLGLNGVCLKSHGGSSAEAICTAVRGAQKIVANNVNRHIAEAVARKG